jgi:hypothetical protein
MLLRKDRTFISFNSVFNFGSKICAEFTDVVMGRVIKRAGTKDMTHLKFDNLPLNMLKILIIWAPF